MSDLAEQYTTLAYTIEAIGTAHHRAGKLQQAGLVLGIGSALAHMPEMPAHEGTRLALAYGRHLAQAAFQTNDGYDQAEATLLAARQQASGQGDARAAADAQDLRGLARYYQALHDGQGSYDDARALFASALREREQSGDGCGIAASLFHLGLIAERESETPGGTAAARDWYERAHQAATEHDCTLVLSYTLRHLAGLAAAQGDLDTALAGFEHSLRLREELDELVLLPLAHLAVSETLSARGDQQGAAEHAVRALELAREQEAPLSLAYALLAVGGLFQARGDFDQARAHYQEAWAVVEASALTLILPEIEARLAAIGAG